MEKGSRERITVRCTRMHASFIADSKREKERGGGEGRERRKKELDGATREKERAEHIVVSVH